MHAEVQNQELTTDSTPIPLRPHTIFGVCEAIGEDFGFNPGWIRVPFAASVLISPTYAIVAYLVLGLVVLASRLIFPKATRGAATTQVAQVPASANEQLEERLAA